MSVPEKIQGPGPSSIVSEYAFLLGDMEKCANAPEEAYSVLPVSGTILSVTGEGPSVLFTVLQNPLAPEPKDGEGIRFRVVRSGSQVGGSSAVRSELLRFVGTVSGLHVFALESRKFRFPF